jgi:hypothetical protein
LTAERCYVNLSPGKQGSTTGLGFWVGRSQITR